MRIPLAASTALLIAACGSGDRQPDPASGNESAAPAAEPGAGAPAAEPAQAAPGARWDLQSSGEGVALALVAVDGPAAIRLFCPTARKRLLVNVPGFRPVGSEERLSFGGGGEAATLVADPGGDASRGGVTGAGAVPADLPALIGGPVSASYGNQRSGPHPPPPAALAQSFVAACREEAPAPSASPAAVANPCLMQGTEPLEVKPLRAVGTEPFWGARIEGRCVTYSHPEDQKGTRIWTRYTPGPAGAGTWSGALAGRRFELRTRPQPGCSDGMSDKPYPVAVELVVGGERRTGCAEPI